MFLETITAFGYEALIPIKDIEYIWVTYSANGWEIHIKGHDECEWIECFHKDEDKLNKRLEIIKCLLGMPNKRDVIKEMKKIKALKK